MSEFYFLVEHLWDLQTELPGRQLKIDRLESRMASLHPLGWIRSSSVPMAHALGIYLHHSQIPLVLMPGELVAFP